MTCRSADLISVIVTTYEREDALDAVLRSLARSATGASRSSSPTTARAPATAALIERWQPSTRRSAHPCLAGASRLPRRRDPQPRAPRRARRLLRLPRRRLHRRVRISSRSTGGSPSAAGSSRQPRAAVRAADRRRAARRARAGTWSSRTGSARRRQGGVNRLAALLHLPLGPLRKLRAAQMAGRALLQSRGLALAISMRSTASTRASTAGAARTSDLLVRLLRAGVRRKDGRFATGVIHLWHPAADRAQLTANDAKLDAVLRSERVRAQAGMSALDHPRARPPGSCRGRVAGLAFARRPTPPGPA